VIAAEERGYTGYCRVIWNDHVPEMTDLAIADRGHFMDVVWAVEEVLRELTRPRKINLASLGNYVPHLHWHVIPRFADDRHFPEAIWGRPQRAGIDHPIDRARLCELLKLRLAAIKPT
jgi:diadenosine tetraphosphate (Ap4A) HIT family hydrolase